MVPSGGLDFEMVKTEPPELQILICRETLAPGAADPKSIVVPATHPPSAVLVLIVAFGAVEALPSRMMKWLPPVV